MTPADRLLPLLDGVRRVAPGRWVAKCPSHDDRSPSLSARELDDGRMLLHCFSGCGVDSVLGALGLAMIDLHPPRISAPGGGVPRERKPWSAGDLLHLAAAEAQIVCIVASDMAQGRTPGEVDRARVIEAARRLGAMVEATQ